MFSWYMYGWWPCSAGTCMVVAIVCIRFSKNSLAPTLLCMVPTHGYLLCTVIAQPSFIHLLQCAVVQLKNVFHRFITIYKEKLCNLFLV